MTNAKDDIKNPDQTPAVPASQPAPKVERPAEVGGPKGPEPTRYQDWERGGRCVDF